MSNKAVVAACDCGKIPAVTRRRKLKESLIARFVALNGAVAIFTIFLIVLFLTKDAIPTFKHVSMWEFLAGTTWQPA